MELISNATEERLLEEYDITFTGGHMMTVAICKDEGDTVDFAKYPSLAVEFHIGPKKGLTSDPDSTLPAEDITLFTSHILAIQKRVRVIKPIPAEQKAAWDNTMRSL